MANLPRGLIAGGARQMVNEAANQLKSLSKASAAAAKAVNGAANSVANGAQYVANNVHKVSPQQINGAVQRGGNLINSGVTSLNNAAERKIMPSVRLTSNVNSNTMNAVRNAANSVAATKKMKMNMHGGARNRKSRRSFFSFF
jgi:alanyl-tRNA synthetase